MARPSGPAKRETSTTNRKPAHEKKDPQAREAWMKQKRERNAERRNPLTDRWTGIAPLQEVYIMRRMNEGATREQARQELGLWDT